MFKVKQFVSSSFCLKCEGCCRFSQRNTVWSPHLLKEEKEKLGKKISLLSNPKARNFICAFFDIQNNKCKSYALRPFECWLYPFLINRKNHKVFLAVDLRCPYIEKKLESQGYKKYINHLTRFFRSPGIIKILKNNPKIIQIYTGVLNIAELKSNL